ncbi:MAG: tetratricopeptide repeat protein [Planctomycetota bacterium]|nr:tetratricopeptide repeat protein [Planctomycetota bacterium]
MTAPTQDMRGLRLATPVGWLVAVAVALACVSDVAQALSIQESEAPTESGRAQEAPEDRAGSNPEEPEPTQDSSPQALASRAALEAGAEDVPVLAIHAMRLLDVGDELTLKRVLTGSKRNSVLGILQALQTSRSVSLLSEILLLASGRDDVEVSQLALDNLTRLSREQISVTTRLIKRLQEVSLSPEVRKTVIQVLGRSRNLDAVEPLIALLGSAHRSDAHGSLEELTGHSLGEDVEVWTAFWERVRGDPRDVLLERSLAAEKNARRESEQKMREEVVQARIRLMGMDVDLLVAGLSDEYAAVRLASASRLGSHPNGEQASTAIPALLTRLGYGPKGSGDSMGHSDVNGHGAGDGNGLSDDQGAARLGGNGYGRENGNGNGSGHNQLFAAEMDAQVRAALVAAVGVLGRGEPAVLDVLLSELRSGDVEMAAVAAAAFVRLRAHPEVVNPLLSYLKRAPVEEMTQVTVLRIVAQNQPAGVLEQLNEWLDPSHSPNVRAAAVAAVLASEELPRALDVVGGITLNEEIREVRYAVAKGLGDRTRGLPAEDSVRSLMLELLGRLLEDVDSSVRAEAASSLGEAGGPDGFALLDRRSRAEVDASVMMRILHALGQIGDREGVGAIGRVCASWSGDGRAELNDAAHRALLVLGDDASADEWLEMAGTLKAVGSPDLSAWSLREILLRHEGDPGSRDVVSLARGHLAEVLCLNGQANEAFQMLVELHEAGAPYPGLRLRLDLLARTAEELGLLDDAADYYLECLEELAVGDSTRLETQRGAVRTLIAAGRYEEAAPLVRDVYEQDASDNNTMYSLARVQAALGRDRAAVDTLRRLLPRIPSESESLRVEVESLLKQVEPGLQGNPAAEEGLEPGGEEAAEESSPRGKKVVSGVQMSGVLRDALDGQRARMRASLMGMAGR